jgi:hypothetical protein
MAFSIFLTTIYKFNFVNKGKNMVVKVKWWRNPMNSLIENEHFCAKRDLDLSVMYKIEFHI